MPIRRDSNNNDLFTNGCVISCYGSCRWGMLNHETVESLLATSTKKGLVDVLLTLWGMLYFITSYSGQ